jgi:transglutaminase-like putative cysteine protease
MGAICVQDSADIHVLDNLTATVDIYKKFEITSESGIRFAQIVIPINDFIEVRNISGYTELPGNKMIKLSKKDISTSSAPGFKGLSGIQAVTISLRTPTIGSRIFYSYRLIVKSLLYLPRITRRTDYPTERLAVSLKWDKKINLHYDSEGVNILPGERRALFTADDLPEIPDEPLSCPDKLHISISTDLFNYDRNLYYSRTWPEVGRFFALLAVQPPETEAELKSLSARLCANSFSRADTLSAFFNFLADSVSYVALQMGKGDFTPHTCSAILNRRFGDCKDQSVLLVSLCRAAGLDAYPALINTESYPIVDELHPWPAWFDHVVTVVRQEKEDLILDPSDPAGSVGTLPPRLRGKSYLVCDGHSPLRTAPDGPNPAFGINWNFHLLNSFGSTLDIEFSLSYLGDAASAHRDSWRSDGTNMARLILGDQFNDYGWNIQNPRIEDIQSRPDTLIVIGRFAIDFVAAADSHTFAIPSPLNSYLLDNIFSDPRKNDYCRGSSLRLEETITIDRAVSGFNTEPEYSDSWMRQGLSFDDELKISPDRAIYHRILNFTGDYLKATDYNSFRDFLLSRRDQQYVKLQR